MLDFGGPDTESQRAKCAMRRRMRIAAYHGHAGLRQALFGSDDVDYALANILDGDIRHTKVGNVLPQRIKLETALVIFHHRQPVGRGRHVVVWHRESAFRAAYFAPRQSQTFKGLRAGDLVDQVAIDVDDRRAVLRHP